jgi:hypothetical protein
MKVKSLSISIKCIQQSGISTARGISLADSILLLSIASLPLYLWSSGLPQISHLLLLAAALFQVFVQRKTFSLSIQAKVLLSLFVLGLCLDVVRAVLVGGVDDKHLLVSVYLLFSVVAFAAYSRLVLLHPRLAAIAFLMALLLAVIGVFVGGVSLVSSVDSDSAYRSAGSFNNPNQLGYFGVCALSLVFMFSWAGILPSLISFLAVAASLFLVVSSLSKAAIISSLVAIIIFTFDFARTFLIKIFSDTRSWLAAIVVLFLILLLSALGILHVPSMNIEDFKLYDRLASIGADNDDSLDARGYWLLTSFGLSELLFGYGASNVNILLGHELHSTFGSFFANYGLFGGLLYIFFFAICFYRCEKNIGMTRSLVCYLPVVLYGITHNGSRFSVLYLFVAASVSLFSARRLRLLRPSSAG